MPLDMNYSRIRGVVKIHTVTEDERNKAIKDLVSMILNRQPMSYAKVTTQNGDYVGLYRKQDEELLEIDILAHLHSRLTISYFVNNPSLQSLRSPK